MLIRRIWFTTPQEERAWLGEIGITEATEWIESTAEGSVKPITSTPGQRCDACWTATAVGSAR